MPQRRRRLGLESDRGSSRTPSRRRGETADTTSSSNISSKTSTLTAKFAWIGLRAERLAWVTRSGNEAVAELGTWRRVHQCLDVPLPETSWMTEPIGRGEFYEWFGTPDPIDPDRPE